MRGVPDGSAFVQLIRRKEERDQIRLAAQEEDLARQYDRWKVPTELRTSQQIRSDPEAREYSYARHALRNSLAQVCYRPLLTGMGTDTRLAKTGDMSRKI